MNQLITLSLISLMSLVGMTLGTYVGYGFAPMYNGGGMAGIGGAGGLGGNFMSSKFVVCITKTCL